MTGCCGAGFPRSLPIRSSSAGPGPFSRVGGSRRFPFTADVAEGEAGSTHCPLPWASSGAQVQVAMGRGAPPLCSPGSGPGVRD